MEKQIDEDGYKYITITQRNCDRCIYENLGEFDDPCISCCEWINDELRDYFEPADA